MSRCLIFIIFFSLSILSCSLVTTYPEERTTKNRIDTFERIFPKNINNNVKVYWQENMIPFVEANNDNDGAFTIGLIHAHLRLGQLELMRMISKGRLSEISGPFIPADIDHFIKMVDLNASAKRSYNMLNKQDQKWLKSYVNGINHYINKAESLPLEFKVFNLQKSFWTEIDAICAARIAAFDINWGNYLQFLSFQKHKGWKKIWNKYIQRGTKSITSFNDSNEQLLSSLFTSISRSGSNSIAIGKNKSISGSAIMANDPHLGIIAPNTWLLMGYKTTSYHVIGYMVPGLPVVTVGRNMDIAFGGTYMRSISSHLFEVDEQDLEHKETVNIKRRWWFDKTVKIRKTAKGPVLNDLKNLNNLDKLVALSWTGCEPSNELGSFLSANRSTTWAEFKNSFKDFAVAGLNVTYANKNGDIGMLLATKQAILKDNSEYYNLVKSKYNFINSYKSSSDLPTSFNPQQDFIISANNMPVKTKIPLAFVSDQNDRMNRMIDLVNEKTKLGVTDLMNIQQDVISYSALELSKKLTIDYNVKNKDLKLLANWDGSYIENSRAALVHELISWSIANELFSKIIPNKEMRKKILSSDEWQIRLLEELENYNTLEIGQLVKKALIRTKSVRGKYKNWGEFHKISIKSPLGFLPIIGSRYRYYEYNAPGSSSTINKVAFSPDLNEKKSYYGAQSRHISDLNDPNENYFVMLGGNDGWLNSKHIYDQTMLWKEGKYLKLPLTIKEVKKVFNLQNKL